MLGVLRPETGDRNTRDSGTGAHDPDRPILLELAHPPDLAAGCWCDLESWAGPAGKILVVRVSGKIDLLSLPAVAAALDEAVSRDARHLVVDVAAMGFCCVRGYRLLTDTHLAAVIRGVGFAISGLTASHDRIMSMVLPRPGPARYPSVAAAVTALRIQDAHTAGR